MRPDRTLLLERLVRNELALQRLLAAARRAASSRLSALRRAVPVQPSGAKLPRLLDRDVT